MRRLTLSLTALWAVSVALAGPLADVDWTQLTIPRLVALPDLDGRISDGEWDRAAPVGGFTMLGDETLSATQPEAWLGWHERGLLLAARIPLPPGQKARAQATDFDGTVWADDSVELHVDRGHRHERHYQFVVNALGTEFDSLAGDKAYNASWHAAATNEPGQWACELLIPWEAMGGGAPQPADRDGLNVAINASSLGGILTLSPISANLHDAARFAHVTYTDGPAAGWCGLDLDGNTATAAVLNAKDAKVELTVDGRPRTVTQQPDSGSAVSQYYVTSLDLPQEQGFTRAGRYQLELRARADGQTLLVQRVALAVGPPVELQVSAYLHRQELATTVALQPGTFPWPDSTVGLQVVADGQAVVERTIEPPADGGPARVTLPADELPAVEDAPRAERQSWEKDLLGFYVSGHPLEEHEAVLRMYATATTAQLASKEDGAEVIIGGVVDSVRSAVTRKGKFEGQRWARYELSDLEGAVGGVMFAQEYAEYGKFLRKDAIVFIKGRVDYQGNDPTLRAQQVIPIERAHALLAGGMALDLDAEAANEATLTALRDLCASNHGELPVYVRIRIPDEGAYTIRVGRNMFVQASTQLLDAAGQLVGRDRVRFIPKRDNGNGNNNGGRRAWRRPQAGAVRA